MAVFGLCVGCVFADHWALCGWAVCVADPPYVQEVVLAKKDRIVPWLPT